MSGNGSEKLRAIFLVSLMFFWLFAGTMAFAGAATAQEPDPDPGQVLALDADGEKIESFGNIGDAIQEEIDGVEVDTVLVGPNSEEGPYEESITIDVEGLTLEAADGASPTVNGPDGVRDTITISANEVTVQELDVVATGGGTPRAIVSTGDDVSIAGNSASHTDAGPEERRTGPLIAVAGGDSVTVDGNTATDGPIAYVGGSNNQVAFTDNTVEGDLVDEAFFAFGGTNPDITFTGNDFSAADAGQDAEVKFDLTDVTVNDETDDAAIAGSVVDSNTDVDTVKVDGNTFDDGNTLFVSNGDSIQSAVDAAGSLDGVDTVRVAEGEFTESVTVDVDGLTLEGPNAGIAVDSDDRGAEASFEIAGDIAVDGVTIDGFKLTGTSTTEIQGANTEIANSDINVPDGDAPFRLQAGADNTVITQNQFADGDGGTFVINARQSFEQVIDGVEITGNSFESITGTSGSGTSIIQAAGFTNAEISGNRFDGISQNAVRLAGDVSGTEVTDNEFSNYAQRSDFATGAILANDVSGDNIDIGSNQFNNAGGENIYIQALNRKAPAALDLSTIADENTFDQGVVATDTSIVPDAGQDEVLNANTSERFDTISDAEDAAGTDETLRVGAGSYPESVDISTDGLTLEGAGADSSTITGEVNIGQGANSVSTTGVTIRGFTIDPDSGVAVETTIEQDSDVTIEDNRIEGAAGDAAAAFFQNPDEIEIRNNEFVGPSPESPEFSNTIGDLLVVGSGKDDDGDNYVIADNTFEGIVNRDQQPSGGNAIEIRTDGAVTVENNDFGGVNSNNGALIWIDSKTTDATINRNNIVHNDGTGNGVIAESGADVDATSNWWGDASGPSGEGPGSGASVSQNVDFEPWLDAQAPDGETVEGDGLDVTLAKTAIDADGETSVESVEEVLSNGETGRDLTEQATFDSEDSTIASVSEDGTITAESPGSTTITAKADGLEGSVDVRVGLIEEIEVAVVDDRIPVGESTDFTVDGTFTDGSVSEVTNNADLELELVTGEDRATIDADENEVTGDAQGAVTLEATLQGETDTAELDVFREETGDVQDNRVEFDEVESTQSVEFEGDVDDDSEVTVSEGTRPPEDAPEPPADVTPVVVPDYEVPEEAADTPATIELEIPEDRLEEVGLDEDELESRLVALREEPDGDGYDPVTIVDIDTDGSGATVTIETPGFSTFILGGSSPTSGGSGGDGGGGGIVSGVPGASVTAGQSVTIGDSRPTAPGTTVTFGQTEVDAITFSAEDVRGTASVARLERVPSSAPPFDPSRPVAAVFEIEVPDERADEPATIEIELETEPLDEAGLAAEDVAVLRALEEEYGELETDVEVDGDTATITAETPGFSTFVVTDSTESTGPTTDTPERTATDAPGDGDGATETPAPASGSDSGSSDGDAETPEPDAEEQPGFGAIVALVALLGAALLAARRGALD